MRPPPAVLELSITPVSLTLPPDTRFSIGDLNYYVSAEKGNGKYEITCETAGEVGNDYGATVIPIEYVEWRSPFRYSQSGCRRMLVRSDCQNTVDGKLQYLLHPHRESAKR